MTSKRYWIGLDLSQGRSNICIIDEIGTIAGEFECECTFEAIVNRASIVPKERVVAFALEAGCGMHIGRKLIQHGFHVEIFESRKLKRLLELRRNKTDVNDARGIAEAARLAPNLSKVYLKSVPCQFLRTRLQLRQKMVLQRLSAEGFVRSLIQLYGGRLPPYGRGQHYREHAYAELERLKAKEGIDLVEELDPLIDMITSLRGHISRLDDWVAKTAGANAVCSRFLEIPGVGPICALSFFSAVERPDRFRRSADVAAYLGLTPRLYQSGDFKRTLGITRMGNKLTRAHLYIAAHNLLIARRKPNAVQEWGLALAARIGRGKARVAVARKLAIVMLSMWKHGSRFEPRLGLT